MGAGDRGVELNVLTQVELVGHVVHPAFDLRLAREALAPAPAFVKLLRKQILVNIAFGIELGTRIAVPVPGAADTRCCIERLNVQPLTTELVKLVKASYACANDESVKRRHLILTMGLLLKGRCIGHLSSGRIVL